MQPGQGLIRRPRGPVLAALGDPGRHRERDRHDRGRRRQHRYLPGQQVRELSQPQPGGQREIADRGVTGQFPPGEPGVPRPVRGQPAQPLAEQLSEIRLQVLDGHVRLRGAADRQVHPDLPPGPGEQRPRRAVGERLGRRIALRDGPPVKQRQDAHVLAPRRRSEPGRDRPRRPVLGIPAQPRLQPLPRIEEPDAVPGQELRPLLHRPRIVLPRTRCRSPARRELAQPAVHHHRRPGRSRAVLQPQVVIDEHGHPLRDQRPVLKIPGLPAPGREKGQDHER